MGTRPMPITVAVVLQALFSLANLFSPLFFGSEDVPAVVIYGGVVLGIVGLVATFGLWMLRKWGVWLTIILSVLNILSAAPGVVVAPDAVLQVAATITVVGYAVLIVLVILPTSRRAFAAA